MVNIPPKIPAPFSHQKKCYQKIPAPFSGRKKSLSLVRNGTKTLFSEL
jgi:hypothetical protein